MAVNGKTGLDHLPQDIDNRSVRSILPLYVTMIDRRGVICSVPKFYTCLYFYLSGVSDKCT